MVEGVIKIFYLNLSRKSREMKRIGKEKIENEMRWNRDEMSRHELTWKGCD